jgi:MerR family transcriptional regulator, light-induced transcriptional regulator
MEQYLSVYSIRDLENFSGIKAHTIRIWEKRYRLLEPERKDSNIRMYSETELKKILNVSYLNRNGYKISKIASLDEDELTGQVMAVSSRNDNTDNTFQPGKILMSAIRFNEDQFKAALQPYIRNYGTEEAYINYLQPLLAKSRILWQTGALTRAQEQFVRNTVKQLIILEDNYTKAEKRETDAVAMINIADNLADCNFLFYKYVLRKRGYDVIFTGDILPSSEVDDIFKIKPFKYLVVYSGSSSENLKKNIDFLSAAGKSLQIKKIIFTDYDGILEKKTGDRIIVSADPADFVRKVSLLK